MKSLLGLLFCYLPAGLWTWACWRQVAKVTDVPGWYARLSLSITDFMITAAWATGVIVGIGALILITTLLIILETKIRAAND